jgi:hypothetical protein
MRSRLTRLAWCGNGKGDLFVVVVASAKGAIDTSLGQRPRKQTGKHFEG